MAITYTKAQRDHARKEGLHLVTLAAFGVEVQAPVSRAEAVLVRDFITEMLNRRAAALTRAADARKAAGT